MISGGPGHRQDRGRPAPGGVPALLQPAPLRVRRRAGRRPEPGVHELHRAGAALPRRGRRSRCARSARSPADVVADHAATGSTRPPAAAIKGSLRMVHGAAPAGAASRRQEVPLELRVTVKGHVLVLPAAGAGPDPGRRAGPPQAQPGPRGRREGAAQRAVAGARRTTSTWSATSSTTWSADTAAFAMFANAWWPAVSAHRRPGPARRSGPAPPASPARCCPTPSSELLSAELPRPAAARPTGPSPTAPCWTSWCTCSGRSPSRRTGRSRCSWTSDGEVAEVVTTVERLATGPRGRPVRTPPHDTYAHILVDEAQDITPMQWRMLRRRGAERQLDDRRRPGPELLAGRRARPRGR